MRKQIGHIWYWLVKSGYQWGFSKLRYQLGIISLLVIAFLCCQFYSSVHGAENIKIAILRSDNLKSTERSISGARKTILQVQGNVNFQKFLVRQSKQSDSAVVDSIKAFNPSLILSVGTASTELAKTHFTKIPIVFSSVLYPALSGFVKTMSQPGYNITGASLNIPIDIQYRTFKDIVPKLKKIGVLYSQNTASLIPPASATARKMGLELVSVKVSEAKQLPNALDSLTSQVDGIWSVADPELFTPQSTRFILLNTIRKGIPFMGFSRHVVESGALFALDLDYKAVGRQAGEIVNRVIAGEKPGKIMVSVVDFIWFHYNEKTAKHIDVTIPSELVAVAKEVYR